MATLSKGYTFGATETVTNSKLHALVDSASITGITNADIAADAAISETKLDLSEGANITTGGNFSITGHWDFSDIDINGGTIDGTPIGASYPSTGAFTTLKVGTTHQGDILYDNGTSFVRLVPGTSGQFLKTQGNGANPTWADVTLTGNIFGAWASKTDNTVYEALTDGIVVAWTTASVTSISAYTDASNPPTTLRGYSSSGNGQANITMPVRKGDFWKVVGDGQASTIYWLPIGS